MLRTLKKEGFVSIVEVVVTSVIFIVTAVGILSSITMFRTKGGASSRKLDAAYIAKNVVDQLRLEVNELAWNDPASTLAPGTHCCLTLGIYTVNYTVTDIPASEVRRVDMNVSYPN